MKSILFRRPTLALLSLGVLGGMIAWTVFSAEVPRTPPNPLRLRAWEKVINRLRQAEGEGAQVGARYLQRLDEFFAEKQGHARGFAEDVLSLSGKWAFLQGKLPLIGDDGKAHQAYLRQAFERHLFSGAEFQRVVQSVVTSYLSELEGQENALLVAIRADLGADDLPGVRDLAALRSDEAFQIEYRKMLTDIIPVVGRDLVTTVGREAVVWVGADIAAAVTTRVASAAATRLGISGGILGTGAATGLETLGIGVVAGFVVDGVVDWLMRRCWGYDPEGDIARHASDALNNIRGLFTEGDPEAHRVYLHLRRLQEEDPISFVREECREAAERVNAGGALGLRHELQRLRQLRERLREAALKKLVLEGVAP